MRQPTKIEPAPVRGSPWRRPVFSRRQLADLKKEAAAAALQWPIPGDLSSQLFFLSLFFLSRS